MCVSPLSRASLWRSDNCFSIFSYLSCFHLLPIREWRRKKERRVLLLLRCWESHRPRTAPHFHGCLAAGPFANHVCTTVCSSHSAYTGEARVYVRRAQQERSAASSGWGLPRCGSLTLRFYFLTSPSRSLLPEWSPRATTCPGTPTPSRTKSNAPILCFR